MSRSYQPLQGLSPFTEDCNKESVRVRHEQRSHAVASIFCSSSLSSANESTQQLHDVEPLASQYAIVVRLTIVYCDHQVKG
jgi:hypothetical protein